jgi:hypothetical protein
VHAAWNAWAVAVAVARAEPAFGGRWCRRRRGGGGERRRRGVGDDELVTVHRSQTGAFDGALHQKAVQTMKKQRPQRVLRDTPRQPEKGLEMLLN